MRQLCPVLLLIGTSAFAQTWTQLPDFPGSPRDDAASFTLGDNIYVGTGMDAGFQLTNDWYRYSGTTNAWSTIATPSFTPRQYCTGFAHTDTGYVFGGVDANGVLNELWAYHPETDSWEQKASLPSGGRFACVAMEAWQSAIIATGMLSGGTPTNEAWKYHPHVDSWEMVAPVPGAPRHRAAVFNDGTGMQVIGGADSTFTALDDAWYYPIWFETGEWYPASALPAPRYSADGSGGMAMTLACGASDPGTLHNDVWRRSGADWITLEPFAGGPRRGGVAASAQTGQPWLERFYYGTGSDNVVRYNDWWMLEYPVGIQENHAVAFALSPVPANAELRILMMEGASNTHVTLTDMQGRSVMSARIVGTAATIPTTTLASGTYLISVRNAVGSSSKRFVVLH